MTAATADIIDGKAFAQGVRARVGEGVERFRARCGRPPGLTVILVGQDPASEVYVRNKARMAQKLGIDGELVRLPAETSEADLLGRIAALNRNPRVDGILVQLPLPAHIDEDQVISSIDPDKDVDGFHPLNVGRLHLGQETMVPCTPLGCLMLIQDRVPDLSGKLAVVVGRSNIVGRPMAALLTQANATTVLAHSRTRDLPALCRQADILVVAVGRPGMVTGDWIKPGALVMDVGINRLEPTPEALAANPEAKARLAGDVAFEEAMEVASAVTPVPGGVGPMTIACLMQATLTAAERRQARAAGHAATA